MKESNESMQSLESPQCATDPSPATYISDQPRTEEWRNYYKIPKLLKEDFYKVQDVCTEAKRMNEKQGVQKKYALIAHKSHLCDGGGRACLSALKSVSDPCNYFVQDNFQVFHTRTYAGGKPTNGSKQISETYGSAGPALLVVDLATCQLVPTLGATEAIKNGLSADKAASENYFGTHPSIGGSDDKGVLKFKSEDERVRFAAMKESLISNIPELKSLEGGRQDCFIDNKRSLPGLTDLEVIKYGAIEIKGIQGVRKLMDEQYLDATGTNPYQK